MKLCACTKVWHGHTTCKGCGSNWNEMARMRNGRYISDNLIVKRLPGNRINVIRFDGKTIHARIDYGV